MSSNRRRVWLCQQGTWDLRAVGLESLPLACGYLKATADADDRIRAEADLRVFNFDGADTTLSVLKALLEAGVPDVVGLSIFGWNYAMFGEVAQTLRQVNPDVLIVFGGTHVTDQAKRVFGMYPAVDVVVNGEGEFTFRELLRAYLGGVSRHELAGIAGLSFKTPDGDITTTQARDRIVNLDEIPSPFLSGALPLTRPNGQFRYDVALMETNRGCPYKCAFCFWGGATGQKMRSFSIDRLREEIALFARLKVANIVLCDSNFGLTTADEEFMELLIRSREETGYPRSLVTSWAKNKGKVFYRIVSRMKRAGFSSSFTLALQTLDDTTLTKMGRRNMKVNDWEDLAEWLHTEGFDVYGELIWGAPGETYDSFIAGYDRLAKHVTRIATYPHLLLPNTDYSERRDEFKLVSWRTAQSDFEYVLSHETMSLEDNRRMHNFLFWARVVAEYGILRYIWTPLLKLAGIKQSEVLLSLDAWFERQTDSIAAGLKACRARMVERLDAQAYQPGVDYFFSEPGLDGAMARWCEEELLPRVPEDTRLFFRELFRYDWLTRPTLGVQGAGAPEVISFDGEEYYVRPDVEVLFDIPALHAAIVAGTPYDLSPAPQTTTLHYKVGFAEYISNHEFFHHFVGKTRAQLERLVAPAESRPESTPPVLESEPPPMSIERPKRRRLPLAPEAQPVSALGGAP
jgi:tRNA A37 methylthiotransferase MiaB